ncbi:NUDIX domain-containing protein [Krasilnikovia sp. MM14-A1259]|uniref:NUDIX domain-containing protein n=1 Tax=Krasilnikovia sp. MM14-A1259 TaxID=3373539 RepID=UPI00382231AB
MTTSERPRHSVSVAAVICDDTGRVLVVQRRDNGRWEIPGGNMSSDDEREKLAAQLRSLSLAEFIDVVRRVLPGHGDREGRNGLTRTLVLAEATKADDTVPLLADEAPVTLDVVAWPDRDYYDGGFGPEPDLFEGGFCEECRVEITSTAKRAFCPVCGRLCHLT